MALLSKVPWLLGARRHSADIGIALLSARFHAGSLMASGSASGAAEEEQEDAAAIARYREKKNFKRRLDGKVLLLSQNNGGWFEAKNDGYVEGSLLLRGGDGLIYYLVSEDLKQIDLSNDQLVGTLFGDGSWEKLTQPLYTQLKDGELKHVRMTPDQFRSVFTVLREKPAADEGAEGPNQ